MFLQPRYRQTFFSISLGSLLPSVSFVAHVDLLQRTKSITFWLTLSLKGTEKPEGNSPSISKPWVKTLKSLKKCFIIIKSENRFVLHSLCNAKHLCYLRLVTRLSDVCVHPSCLFWPWGENEYTASTLFGSLALFNSIQTLPPPASISALNPPFLSIFWNSC